MVEKVRVPAPSGLVLCLLALTLTLAGEARANNFYVSPSGSPSNTGSISSPWDIVTGLNNSTVRPGDTVWLRNGTYGTGDLTILYSSLSGMANLPIYVRQYPGERATIDGGLGIEGNYVWYWDFEVDNDNWAFPRVTSDTGSFPGGKPSDAIFFNPGATGNKIINMIIHDAADGIADEQEAVGTEDYGNLTYNNGWNAPDRGHGHGLYLQNGSSTVKYVTNNINYNSFDIGIQGYGSAGPVEYMDLNGNVSFNAGLPAGHRVDNIAFEGGGGPEMGILVANGVFYNPLNATSENTGYNEFDGPGVDLTLENNYWIGATPTGYTTLQLENYQTLVFTGNTVVGPITFSNIPTNTWSGNTYYNSAPPSGLDPNSPIYNTNPAGVQVIVQPNKYEPGRANIIVMNWAQNPTVTVNISSSGLQAGEQFEVVDAQNFWGPPVLAGTWDGMSPIQLPMILTQVSPITMGFPTPAHTSAEFNVFILVPVGTVASPPPLAPAPVIGLSVYSLTFSGTSGGAVASQPLTISNTGAANTTLNWTAVSNQSWLSISPASGHDATGTGTSASVSVTTTGLAPGTYQGTLSFSDPNALNNAQTVSVTLTVAAPPPPSGTSFITSVTSGTVRNDFAGFVGMSFTVGANPLTVSYLARFELPGNSGSHVVKLTNASTGQDVPGGSVTINAAGATPGLFVYGALANPIVLSANTTYYLSSQEAYGGDTWYDLDTVVQTTTDAADMHAAYYFSNWYVLAGAENTYGPPNFAYVVGDTVVTPPANPTPPTNPAPPANPPPPPSGGTAFVTSQTLGTLRNNFSGWVGLQFTVGSSPLTVTEVGRFVAPGNTGSHIVKLVNASTGQDVAGSAASVNTAGATAGTWVYGAVNSVVLSANTTYYLVSEETNNGDSWYDWNTIVQTTVAGSPVSAVYYYGSSYYPIAYAGTSYGPVNFQYQQGGTPVSAASSTVSFLQFDLSTFGSWIGVYGADGEGIEADVLSYPSYATVTISNASTYTWASSTTDVRALQRASNPATRVAAAWYASTNFTIGVNLTDGNTHEIALYGVDWDNEGRDERIDVIDTASGTVLDSRTLSNFRIGEYVVWNVQGNVTFSVTNLGPGNCVISGIFFGK